MLKVGCKIFLSSVEIPTVTSAEFGRKHIGQDMALIFKHKMCIKIVPSKLLPIFPLCYLLLSIHFHCSVANFTKSANEHFFSTLSPSYIYLVPTCSKGSQVTSATEIATKLAISELCQTVGLLLNEGHTRKTVAV